MGGKSTPISTSEQRILSLQVQQSSQGLTLPVVYGRTRIAGNLIWYGDFAALQHTTTTRSGKGGGGVKQVDTKYSYEAAVMMALCEGGIRNVVSVWREKEKFSGAAGLAQIGLALAKGERDQPVWAHLSGKHPEQALNYSDTAYVYGAAYPLTKSAQIYSHNFEIDGKLGYSEQIADANPRDILVDLLTNPNYGCGFPAENLGNTEVYSAYCRALGLFLSPSYSEQQPAQESIGKLLEQTHSAAVFSEGCLKIVPYGDAAAEGNGAVYVPDLTPVYDLDDDDFIVGGADDPVKVERKTNADAYNRVQIEYLDRANDYNIAIAEAKDQANIEKFGLRSRDADEMHAVCDKAVAQQIAQLALQRALYVRNEYEFRLGWKYCLLEPMDLVTLTDPALGLNQTPVRIIEVEEDADGTLTVRAEDFPFGSSSAVKYPSQPQQGYTADYNAAPGNAAAPLMFEAPLNLTGGQPQIWLATAGGEHWGGCEVWVSLDGDSYRRAGNIDKKARLGSLQTALPEGAVFDAANRAEVALVSGSLADATAQEARDMLSACYAGGEFFSYERAELTGLGRYRLSGLVRGAWGSAIRAHKAGEPFVRLDDALFRYDFSPDLLGRTVWVKLVSYNVFGSGMQELGEVPAYSYTIQGAPVGTVANLRLTSEWAYGTAATIVWDKLEGADSYDVEIYAAGSQTRLRRIEGIAANSYTYTLADMKADGGQVRDIVFKVRGRALTGKTGGFVHIGAQNPQLRALSGIQTDSGLRQAFFQCAAPEEADFAGVMIWLSDQAACPPVDENLVYDGRETYVALTRYRGQPLEGGKTYYLRAAGYDSFGRDRLNISQSVGFTVYGVNEVARDLDEGSLSAGLRTRIEKIDGNGADSINERLNAQSQDTDRKIAAGAAAQSREIQAAKSEIAAAKSELTRFGHTLSEQGRALTQTGESLTARLDGLQVGGRNLLRNSSVPYFSSAYRKQYELAAAPKVGETFTVTFWGEIGSDRTGVGIYNTSGYGELARAVKIADGVYRAQGVWRKPIRGGVEVTPNDTHLNLYFLPGSGQSENRIDRIKLEIGSIPSDWSPAPEDGEQQAAGIQAALDSFKQTQASDNRALVQRIDTAAAKIGTVETKVTQATEAVADLNGKVQSGWGVKIETLSGGKRVVSGIQSVADARTGESAFNVMADRFALIDPKSKAARVPFVVQTVNGQSQMALDGDFIGSGTIHGKHIAAGQTIQAPTINGGSLNIGNGAAVIAPDGSAEFQNITARGVFIGEAGHFKGTVSASKIEGDVLKVYRMNPAGDGVWELRLPACPAPRLFSLPVMVFGQTAQKIKTGSHSSDAQIYLPGIYVNGGEVGRAVSEGSLLILRQQWFALRAGMDAVIRFSLTDENPNRPPGVTDSHRKAALQALKVSMTTPAVTIGYMDEGDAEYAQYRGTLTWQTPPVESLTLTEQRGALALPDSIYGVSFDWQPPDSGLYGLYLHTGTRQVVQEYAPNAKRGRQSFKHDAGAMMSPIIESKLSGGAQIALGNIKVLTYPGRF